MHRSPLDRSHVYRSLFHQSLAQGSWPDRILAWGLGGAALAAAGIVVLILAFLAREAWPSLREIGPYRFFADDAWRPTSGKRAQFGAAPMLAASLLVAGGAMLLAGPVGLLLALFSCFYAPPWAASFSRRLIELLAGVPSVIFGFWGLVVLAPLINEFQPPGQSLLAGMLVLAMMIVPTAALTAEAALRAAPREQLHAAAALALGRWAMIRHIVLPAARSGIAAGMLLAAARAIGETMAVMMVCGNKVQLPASLFDPVRTITANIALEMGYAGPMHRSALFSTGLLLMGIIGGALLLVEMLRKTKK